MAKRARRRTASRKRHAVSAVRRSRKSSCTFIKRRAACNKAPGCKMTRRGKRKSMCRKSRNHRSSRRHTH